MKISTLLEITLLFERLFCYNMNTLLVCKTLLAKLGEYIFEMQIIDTGKIERFKN